MYPSALSTKINSDVEFSRHLVESRSDKLRQVKSSPVHADFCSEAAKSRSDKLRQVKSSPIHADYEYTTSHGFENQNQNCSRRKTTQLDLHLRSLLRL
ncbi:hypothetical protein NPIL_573941, partial [Nephila pilipes]